MATSQNGWPALSSGSRLLHKWVVPNTERHFVLRNGSAGFLLAFFVSWYHDKVHPLNEKGSVWDEWAWAWRPIRGQVSGLSNHSSGTAVDLNATKYPLGTMLMALWRKTKIRAHFLVLSGVIRWGGDYSGRKDEMHFEINRGLQTCERVARRLMKTKRGKEILAANKGQAAVILS